MQHARASTMYQQLASTGIVTLSNAKQALFSSGGELPRNEAEPGRKMADGSELCAGAGACESRNRCCREMRDTGHRRQARGDIIGARDRFDLAMQS